MDRRELLKMIALATGSAFIGGELFLSGCTNTPDIGGPAFSEADISFLDEVAETILPKTTSPGAKEAAVGAYMTVMVNDCYAKDDQKIFHEGIKKLDDACKKTHNTGFLKASPEQRTSFLIALDKEAKENQQAKKKEDPNHYFTMMKQLTLAGFFTSKPGATQALRHVAVPAKYDGSYPYKKGDKAWADQP
ncbi:MAG: gluconate 2-dehydrogenase subunit 3 family protein [Chitinophagaceae bacterium]